MGAIDFTTIEVWTKGGLVTYYLLFVMEVATRRVHLAACTPTLGDNFMKQIARNLTDTFDGFLKDKRYILMDRDANFSFEFRMILKEAGARPVRLPPQSPDWNSHLERFHLSLKPECLEEMIFFGEQSLRRAVESYLSPTTTANEITKERSNNYCRLSLRESSVSGATFAERKAALRQLLIGRPQGLVNKIIQPGDEVGRTTGEIARQATYGAKNSSHGGQCFRR